MERQKDGREEGKKCEKKEGKLNILTLKTNKMLKCLRHIHRMSPKKANTLHINCTL